MPKSFFSRLLLFIGRSSLFAQQSPEIRKEFLADYADEADNADFLTKIIGAICVHSISVICVNPSFERGLLTEINTCIIADIQSAGLTLEVRITSDDRRIQHDIVEIGK